MANASIGGLVSGLDTATIISQLMQVESQPQTLLKSRLSTQQSAVSALQSLNKKFAALVTQANDLAKANGLSPVKATSSSEHVTATVGSTASPGTLAFTVKQTASAHQLTFNQTARGTDTVTEGSNFVLLNGESIDTGDGTLDGLVRAINASSADVTASTVRLDDGKYRLRVTADSTGEASVFTLTNSDGSPVLGGAAISAGQDARIAIGPDTVSSSTNTFTGVMAGLDLVVAPSIPADTTVDVTVTRDPKAASDSVKGLVAAANEILAEIDKLTAYDAVTKKSGSLAGDSTLRALRSEVLETVSGVTSSDSVAFAGVQLDRYGKITFDEARFASAYAANPGDVATKMGGLAVRLKAAADGASNATTGTLTAAIKGRQDSVGDMQDAIESWDDRLALRRSTLTRQFTALEVALGKLQGQSSWLAGQISSLPSMNK